MIKLFVVDDEEIICDGIASMPWEKYEIDCVGKATDELTALDMICKLRPEIVITDIRMTGKGGIWLAEKVSNFLPHTKIIFLSGYQEFEYAQKAIKLNVFEYLLKPIKPNTLIETVVKAKNAVISGYEQRVQIETFRRQMNESRMFMKNWFFSETKNSADAESLYKKLDFWGINLTDGWFRTIVIRFSQPQVDSQVQFNFFRIFHDIETLFAEDEYHCSFFEGSEFTYVVNMAETDYRVRRQSLYAFCDRLEDYLNYNYDGTYIIGVSEETDDILSLDRSRTRAAEACKYRFYMGDNRIVYIDDIEPVECSQRYDPMNIEEYITAIKVGSEENLEKAIDSIFADMQNRLEDIGIVKRVCLELVLYTSNVIYELGMRPEMLFNNTDIWNVINKCGTISEVRNLMLNINKVVISNCHSTRVSEIKKITTKVKELINEQYAGGITLESAAESVYVSPHYLSMLFKKDTGITFKEYLINYRITKAKELLMDQSLKIYQVAEMVGYGDWRYFSEVFKRITGQSPAQYRAALEQ